MIFCTGNASETAVSAQLSTSEIRETNTLSTTLYSACTSMESAMGSAMFQSSFPIGMTPMLFSKGFMGFSLPKYIPDYYSG